MGIVNENLALNSLQLAELQNAFTTPEAKDLLTLLSTIKDSKLNTETHYIGSDGRIHEQKWIGRKVYNLLKKIGLVDFALWIVGARIDTAYKNVQKRFEALKTQAGQDHAVFTIDQQKRMKYAIDNIFRPIVIKVEHARNPDSKKSDLPISKILNITHKLRKERNNNATIEIPTITLEDLKYDPEWADVVGANDPINLADSIIKAADSDSDDETTAPAGIASAQTPVAVDVDNLPVTPASPSKVVVLTTFDGKEKIANVKGGTKKTAVNKLIIETVLRSPSRLTRSKLKKDSTEKTK